MLTPVRVVRVRGMRLREPLGPSPEPLTVEPMTLEPMTLEPMTLEPVTLEPLNGEPMTSETAVLASASALGPAERQYTTSPRPAGKRVQQPGLSEHCLNEALLPCLQLWQVLVPEQAEARSQPDLITARVRATGCCNVRGQPLHPCFDPPKGSHYEVAILRDGMLAFRLGSWHDWFNLLSWQVWPHAKAALNLRHTMHYLMQLQRLFPIDWQARIGQSIQRDVWMQTIAMLDEGGCVVTDGLLDAHARIDGRRVFRWQPGTTSQHIRQGLRWFGHGVLEQLQLRAESDRLALVSDGQHLQPPAVSEFRQGCEPLVSERPQPEREPSSRVAEEAVPETLPPTENGLRMFVARVPELTDLCLSLAILRFDPSLSDGVARQLTLLEQMGISIPGEVLNQITFGAHDLFLKPAASVWNPWDLSLRG